MGGRIRASLARRRPGRGRRPVHRGRSTTRPLMPRRRSDMRRSEHCGCGTAARPSRCARSRSRSRAATPWYDWTCATGSPYARSTETCGSSASPRMDGSKTSRNGTGPASRARPTPSRPDDAVRLRECAEQLAGQPLGQGREGRDAGAIVAVSSGSIFQEPHRLQGCLPGPARQRRGRYRSTAAFLAPAGREKTLHAV